ncbi:MAG: sugar ABC transporter permease [Burkholderiales bacterium]|nr:sugar ABC transporter permease [Burkholderiales bacterium]
MNGTSPAAARARATAQAAWRFLAPTLAVMLLVAAWPLARTLFFGFTDATLFDTGDYRFIGLGNYLGRADGEWFGLLADPYWWRALYNTLSFTLASVLVETVLGVLIALILNTQFRGRGLVRAALLVPWAIPTVVCARMWAWMLNDQFGVINDLLLRAGLIAAPIAWLAEPSLALWAAIAVDIWKTTPFVALLALAALQMVPNDCYEAARIDGVNPVVVFFRVTLPLIRPALLVAVTFRLLDAMRVFDVIYAMTGTAATTQTLSIFARQQLIDFQDVGYGSAASTTLFVATALLAVACLATARGRGPRR